MIDAAPEYLQTIARILAKHVPGCEIRVFGSRVNGTAKKYSDLDLAVVGKTRMAPDVPWRLKEAFEMCDLPFRVDVVDWEALSDDFRNVIARKYEILPAG